MWIIVVFFEYVERNRRTCCEGSCFLLVTNFIWLASLITHLRQNYSLITKAKEQQRTFMLLAFCGKLYHRPKRAQTKQVAILQHIICSCGYISKEREKSPSWNCTNHKAKEDTDNKSLIATGLFLQTNYRSEDHAQLILRTSSQIYMLWQGFKFCPKINDHYLNEKKRRNVTFY